MSENSGDEKLSTQSVTTSWIQLDDKNGKSTSSETSPQYSDNDDNEDNMTDALAEASKSLYNSQMKGVDIEEDQVLQTVRTEETTPTTIGSSRLMYFSTLLLSHSILLVIGVLIGRKSLTLRR